MSTPHTGDETKAVAELDSPPLRPDQATKFRGIIARLNYLSMDRPDIQYATREASKRMATPREADWRVLQRIGRYLVGVPRLVQN